MLRLDLRTGAIELHPYLTVVRGLAPTARAELLQALADIPSGHTAISGLIEAHGVLLDLAPATLELLDLDPEAELDVIVRVEDLPNHHDDAPIAVREARRALAAAESAAKAATEALAEAAAREARGREALHRATAGVAGTPGREEPAGHEATVEAATAARVDAERRAVAARTAHEAALVVLEELEAAAEAAREQRATAGRAVSVAVAALDTASDRRDPAAAAVVDAARRQLEDAEASLDATRRGEVTEAAPAGAADERRARRLSLEAALLALDTIDPLPVSVALDEVRSGGGDRLVPHPLAIALADELAALPSFDGAGRAGSVGKGGKSGKSGKSGKDVPVDLGVQRVAARRRVEAAERLVAALEEEARGPAIDAGDLAELERRHQEVLDAEAASERRFGAAKSAKRLEDARAARQEVLDRLGYTSHMDFLLAAGGASGDLPEPDLTLPQRLEQARIELRQAQTEQTAVDAALADELARAEVLDKRRQIRSAAVALLGEDPGDDVEGALRRHRVPATATGEHLQRLRQALEGTGLVLADEDVDERLLVDLARVWLEEQAATADARRELERQIAEIDVELAALEARERAPVQGEPLAAAAGAVEDARAALAAAEARAARDAHTEEELDALREDFEAATRAEAAAVNAVAAAEAAVADAVAASRATAADLRRAEDELARATADEVAAVEDAAALAEQVAAARAEGVAALEAEVAAATAAAEAAGLASTLADREVDEQRRALATAESAWAAAGEEALPVDADQDAEDVEWYLLARLAGQRSVSYAGSVPLVLDDALAALDVDHARSVLDRIERMASTVQLVVVTEDLATATWAELLGPERAHVTS